MINTREPDPSSRRLIGDLNDLLITELFHIKLPSPFPCTIVRQMETGGGGGAMKYCNKLSVVAGRGRKWPDRDRKSKGCDVAIF